MVVPFESEMRAAIEQRDPAFDGRFYYGDCITGVFCRVSCSEKVMKDENIRYFTNIEAAMSAGFHPCAHCQPVDIQGEVSQITKLIEVVRHIEAHAQQTLTLGSLAKIANLSPTRLQKVFKKTFGISPKIYQKALRLNLYKSQLKTAAGVTDAIYAAGFGSISGVYGEAERNIGMPPTGGSEQAISYACRHSALGLMLMGATDKGVCLVQFGDDEAALLTQLQSEFPKASLHISAAQHAPELDNWMEQLNQHISEGAPRPDIPLDIRGTAFQMKVWQFLLSVKEGDQLSYGEVAEQMGAPKAARAVGTACAKNRIAVLIPCHRVLRGDGGLGGYRWGLARKQILLNNEAAARDK